MGMDSGTKLTGVSRKKYTGTRKLVIFLIESYLNYA